MVVHPLLKKVTAVVRSWIDRLQGKPKPEHPLIRYGTPILFTALMCAPLFATYLGYRWYSNNYEQRAQYACSQLIDEYLKLSDSGSSRGLSDEVLAKSEAIAEPDLKAVSFELFAKKAWATYAAHKRSAVAPYIGLLAVDAELKLGKHEEAVAGMDQLVAATAHNKIAGDLFKIKQALLMIDSANPNTQEAGFKNLALLADNTDNPHRDYALYQLGLYHWNNNDVQNARVAWQELVESQEVELRAPSPWVEGAAEKLATIPSASVNPIAV